MARPKPRAGRSLVAHAIACVLFTMGVAFAQDAPEGDDERGRVPAFEVVERVERAQTDVDLAVDVEILANETPAIVLVGPEGLILERTGAEAAFDDLSEGDYLIAATAPGMRLAYGTLTARAGEAVRVALRVFDLPRYYADEAEVSILGIFTIDVADNVAEGFATLEVRAQPAGKIAVVGADGFVATRSAERETHTFEGLEVGPYLVAVTLGDHALAVATVRLQADERTTLDVRLEAVQP